MEPALITFLGSMGASVAITSLVAGYYLSDRTSLLAKRIASIRLKKQNSLNVLADSLEWDEKARAFRDGEALLSEDTLNNKTLSILILDALHDLKMSYKSVQKSFNLEPIPEINEAISQHEDKAFNMSAKTAPSVTTTDQELHMIALMQLRELIEAYSDRNKALSSTTLLTTRQEALTELRPYIQAVEETQKSWRQIKSSHEINRLILAGS